MIGPPARLKHREPALCGVPIGRHEYLYLGRKDVAKDLAYYVDVLGAEVVWDFSDFGTGVAAAGPRASEASKGTEDEDASERSERYEVRVAGVRLFAEGPMVLIAGHRHSPSLLPVFHVEDLDKTDKELRARGWKPEGPRFGIPDGDCYLFKDPSGNELALYENSRPHALER